MQQRPQDFISKYVIFGYNYPINFIQAAWKDNPDMAKHLQSKFSSYYDQVGSSAVMSKFYVNLDGKNREILVNYIMKH